MCGIVTAENQWRLDLELGCRGLFASAVHLGEDKKLAYGPRDQRAACWAFPKLDKFLTR